MITPRGWALLSEKVRSEKLFGGGYIFIPSNKHGIPEGYYSRGDIRNLLRGRLDEPAVVKFVKDMVE